MPKKIQKNRKNNKKWVGILGFVVLLVGAGVVSFAVLESLNNTGEDAAQSEREVNKINYEEPSKDEIAVGEDIKKDRQTEAENEVPTGGDGEVFVVDAEQYGKFVEVSARVDGVVEDGGMCEYEFSKGGVSFEKTQEAVADAKYTSCGALAVAVGEFSEGGEWTVVVSYKGAATASAKVGVTK